MDIQDLEKLIKGRRSIRKWMKKGVSDDLLKKAIELATWAPNGGNYQGWHFVIVKNAKMIEKMADAVQAVSERIAGWPEAKAWPEEVERFRGYSSFFRNAPVCIGVFGTLYQSVADKILLAREPFDNDAKRVLAFRRSAPTGIQSMAAAVTTMLLVFHQMGLGAVWLGAPLMAKKDIETLLNVSQDQSLICLVAVGYPDESPQKDRWSVDQVIDFVR